jgi:large subunit ribosomal protein L37Ae
MKTKKVKAAGRFGARYGRRVKIKIVEIESKQRKKQQCPFCKGITKRLSKGIWRCKRCNKKFAGDVYYLKKEE